MSFSSETLAFTYLWVITREDSEVLYFTTFPNDIVCGGNTYLSAPSLAPVAVSSSTGSGIDNSELTAIIDDDSVTTLDLLQGRYDNADVKIYIYFYRETSPTPLLIYRGLLGEVNIAGDEFKAEMRGLMQRATQNIGEVTSEVCRVKTFGDTECGFNAVASATHTGTVGSVTDQVTFLSSGLSVTTTHIYAYGILTWLTGDNAGIVCEVADNTGAAITLTELMYGTIAAGDTFKVVYGCDRTLAKCLSYANVVNFRGEPHVPNEDVLLRPDLGSA